MQGDFRQGLPAFACSCDVPILAAQQRGARPLYAFVVFLVTPATCWGSFPCILCSAKPNMSVLFAVQRFRPNPQSYRRQAQAAAAAGGICLTTASRTLHVLILFSQSGNACGASCHHFHRDSGWKRAACGRSSQPAALSAEQGELPGGEANALAIVMAEQPDGSQEGAVGTRRDGGSALTCFQHFLQVHSSNVQSQDLVQR